MKKFKINYHKAKNYSLGKTQGIIDNYNKKYPTPKYLLFIKHMLEQGWTAKVYVSKVSKYVFVENDTDRYKIRFSNHKPLYHREQESDCDFYVGVSNLQVSTTAQIVEKLLPKKTEDVSV